MDEVGFDQMLGGFTLTPEHLHEMQQPGLDGSVFFERILDSNKSRPQFFFAESRRPYLRQWLRDTVLQSVIDEWGLLDYDRVVFKSPNGSHAADLLMDAMPLSKMIFLMRDPRDVLASRFSSFASSVLSETKDEKLRLFAIQYYASFWNFQMSVIERAYDRCRRDRRLYMKYEDLRREDRESHRQLLEFVGHTPSDEELDRLMTSARLESMPKEQRGPHLPRNSGKVGRFREFFTAREIESMNRILAPRLRQYGYEL